MPSLSELRKQRLEEKENKQEIIPKEKSKLNIIDSAIYKKKDQYTEKECIHPETEEDFEKISIDDLSFYYFHITGQKRKHNRKYTKKYMIDEIIKVLKASKGE